MNCESCGGNLQPGDEFCQSCGAKVEAKKETVETVEKVAPATETVYTAEAPTSQIMEPAKKTAAPVADKPGFAIAGLVLGIITLVAWLLMPLIGYITGIVGIILSVKGMKSSRKSMAIAGLVMCIVGLVITVAWHCAATCLIMSAMQ